MNFVIWSLLRIFSQVVSSHLTAVLLPMSSRQSALRCFQFGKMDLSGHVGSWGHGSNGCASGVGGVVGEWS